MIPFNRPAITGKEEAYIKQAIMNGHLSGDGEFTKKCHSWIEKKFGVPKALLTTSCTHALEIAAMLVDIQEGDEVIVPSYTFVSTANPFVIRGAKIVFVDVYPDTMNMNIKLVEKAITSKTKAIVPVHYAGVSCDMDPIMEVATKNNIIVIEDAAQGVMSQYKGKYLGTIGHLGCYSFHETKNYNCGEGGALLINDPKFLERAEIIREKGTNRARFFRGQVDKYSWVDIGSSYLPSELNAAFLYAQLEEAEKINEKRLECWIAYKQGLEKLLDEQKIELPVVPEYAVHNSHMFFIKTKNLEERTQLIKCLKESGIHAVFHYVPLHSSLAGKAYGSMYGDDMYTTIESERLVRLPLFYSLSLTEVDKIVECIYAFYKDL